MDSGVYNCGINISYTLVSNTKNKEIRAGLPGNRLGIYSLNMQDCGIAEYI